MKSYFNETYISLSLAMMLNLVFSTFISLHLIDQVFGSSHEMDHSKIISKVIAKWWRGQAVQLLRYLCRN